MSCVYPEQCPCPSCIPVPSNCSNVITPTGGRCNCPFCGGIHTYLVKCIIDSIDCPIEGQEYQQHVSCPKTCDNPHLLCTTEDLPGCGCPNNQVIDETNNRCVHIDNCPS